MGNVPVTTVFGVITAGDFVLGIYGTVSRARVGGKDILSGRKNYPHACSIATAPVQRNRSHRYP